MIHSKLLALISAAIFLAILGPSELFGQVVPNKNPSPTTLSIERLADWVQQQCLAKLNRSPVLKVSPGSFWVICFVAYDHGKLEILASLGGEIQKSPTGGPWYVRNEPAEMRIDDLTWRLEGNRLWINGDCSYTRFSSEAERSDLTGAAKIKAFVERGWAVQLLGSRMGDGPIPIEEAIGTALVLAWP